MPVKKEPSGRRSVEAEVEVPGTPEQVWRAIATGPGVSSWFVPTRVEERTGGKIAACFGPNMDSVSEITKWDPPRAFAADSDDMCAVGGPKIATEWTVEARTGGTCVVRVVHSWFASTDDWDEQWEQTEYGWRTFFRILRAYLTDFRDQAATMIQLAPQVAEEKSAAWDKLTRRLGIERLEVGARVQTPPGAPRLSGKISRVGEAEFAEELFLHIEDPAPGYVHMFAMPMGGSVLLIIRLFLFGPTAPQVAKREEETWRSWTAKHIAPAPPAQ